MIFSKKLVQFLAVAQYGSLIKASTAINTTPSAISQGIHDFELRMGRKLVQKPDRECLLPMLVKTSICK